MTNRYYTDTGDPFENNEKQKDLDYIQKTLSMLSTMETSVIFKQRN